MHLGSKIYHRKPRPFRSLHSGRGNGGSMASEKIRNVVLVGHSGSGKTALAEALLFAAGATTRMGRVEDGNTVTDFEPEEVRRGISVSLALAPVEWGDVK